MDGLDGLDGLDAAVVGCVDADVEDAGVDAVSLDGGGTFTFFNFFRMTWMSCRMRMMTSAKYKLKASAIAMLTQNKKPERPMRSFLPPSFYSTDEVIFVAR